MFYPFAVDETDYSSSVRSTRDVRARECRFPIAEAGGDDFHLCREPIVRGSYCACHATLAYAGTVRVPMPVLAIVGARTGRSH